MKKDRIIKAYPIIMKAEIFPSPTIDGNIEVDLRIELIEGYGKKFGGIVFQSRDLLPEKVLPELGERMIDKIFYELKRKVLETLNEEK